MSPTADRHFNECRLVTDCRRYACLASSVRLPLQPLRAVAVMSTIPDSYQHDLVREHSQTRVPMMDRRDYLAFSMAWRPAVSISCRILSVAYAAAPCTLAKC